MKESKFQGDLIKELELIFPDCLVLKNDPNYKSGIPDLAVLFGNKWAFLECKQSSTARREDAQKYYIEQANREAFGSFIFPENKKEILDRMARYFGDRPLIKEKKHSPLAPSTFNTLIRKEKEDLLRYFRSSYSTEIGTLMHEYAQWRIDQAWIFRKKSDTNCVIEYLTKGGIPKRVIRDYLTDEAIDILEQYINDCVKDGMETEKELRFNEIAFGTTDAIKFNNNILDIRDYKSGKTKVHMIQLEAYAALWCLENDVDPRCIETRLTIYQVPEKIFVIADPETIRERMKQYEIFVQWIVEYLKG